MKRRIPIVGLFLCLLTTPAVADEIFVAPVPLLPVRMGNYQVTVSPDTSLTFALSNDMTAFTGAKIEDSELPRKC